MVTSAFVESSLCSLVVVVYCYPVTLGVCVHNSVKLRCKRQHKRSDFELHKTDIICSMV